MAVSLQIQTVLYHNHLGDIEKSLESIDAASRYAKKLGRISEIHVAYGDSSADPIVDEAFLVRVRAEFSHIDTIRYTFFAKNMGSAGGQSALSNDFAGDYLLLFNPDVLLAPNTLHDLIVPFDDPSVGETEGRQLPIEHPKDYDPITGETGWATMACAMVPAKLFHDLGRLDSESFFLYCDDVDFSWRVRLAGKKVLFVPQATAFHAKKLDLQGSWIPTEAERYYSAEAALFMAYKWSRTDLLTRLLAEYRSSNDAYKKKAAKAFENKQSRNSLPIPLDPNHLIGEFKNGNYTRHRYIL